MRRGLGAAFLLMLALDTLGALAGTDTKRPFLPPPRMYIATWVLYALLGLVAGAGPRLGRFASRLGWLVVLGALLGKYGTIFIGAINRAASLAAPVDAGASQQIPTLGQLVVGSGNLQP